MTHSANKYIVWIGGMHKKCAIVKTLMVGPTRSPNGCIGRSGRVRSAGVSAGKGPCGSPVGGFINSNETVVARLCIADQIGIDAVAVSQGDG